MDKERFLEALRSGLKGLPREELEERLSFYSEMIDDHMEDGLSEEAAVASVGSVDDIVSQILEETPLYRLAAEKVRPKRSLRVWEILFLILGSPIWLPLLIAVVSVLFSVYVVLWSVIIALHAVVVSIFACGLGGLILGGVFIGTGKLGLSVFMLGFAMVCTGMGILSVIAVNWITRGLIWLTKMLFRGIKRSFVGEGK